MLARRLRFSPSMVVSLGGVSYAAVKIPARSGGSKELRRPAVAKVSIRSNAAGALG
jgi:hypothetical protein